jgi:hypothetical protein
MTVSTTTGRTAGPNDDWWSVEAHLEQYSTYKHAIEAEDDQSSSSNTPSQLAKIND